MAFNLIRGCLESRELSRHPCLLFPPVIVETNFHYPRRKKGRLKMTFETAPFPDLLVSKSTRYVDKRCVISKSSKEYCQISSENVHVHAF